MQKNKGFGSWIFWSFLYGCANAVLITYLSAIYGVVNLAFTGNFWPESFGKILLFFVLSVPLLLMEEHIPSVAAWVNGILIFSLVFIGLFVLFFLLVQSMVAN